MPWWINVLKDTRNWNITSDKLNPQNAVISISTNSGKWCFVTQMNIIPNALPPNLTLCSQTTTFVISWAGCFFFNLLFFCAMSVIVANFCQFWLVSSLKVWIPIVSLWGKLHPHKGCNLWGFMPVCFKKQWKGQLRFSNFVLLIFISFMTLYYDVIYYLFFFLSSV